jgi:tRNA dimethylallyltransferase
MVIAGPTASGKTELALWAARRLGAEIVSADSQQVYRHFDIGMAKPSAEALAEIPHHLVSCIEPTELFSGAKYQQMADAALADIHRRGKRAIVVGGTGLYIRMLLHGVVSASGSDPAYRAQLNPLSNDELYERLIAVDQPSAQRLARNDRVRMIRALEIHHLTGVPASIHREQHAFRVARYSYRLVILDPPREAVYAAINERARMMFRAGLVAETKRLVEMGYRNAAPMRAVGYAQALQVVDGTMSEREAIDDVAQKTRHYAKRQWTWFRKEPGAIRVQPPYLTKVFGDE